MHVKYPLQIVQQNRSPSIKLFTQMFPIKKSASSLNSKFQFCFSFKFQFDLSGGEKKPQQMDGNEEPQVLPCTNTQSSKIKLPLCDWPRKHSIPCLVKRRQGLSSTGWKFQLLEAPSW